MTPEEIRLALFKVRKKASQSSIARSLGVSRQAVIGVIDRKFASRRIREEIAKTLGKDINYVFPEELLRRTSRIRTKKVTGVNV